MAPADLSDREKRIILADLDRATEQLARARLSGRTEARATLLLYRGRYDGQSLTWPHLECPEILVFERGQAEPTLLPSAADVAQRGGPSYYRVGGATYTLPAPVDVPARERRVAAAAYYVYAG